MLPERKNSVDFHLPLTCPLFSNISSSFFQIIMTFFFSAFPFFKPFWFSHVTRYLVARAVNSFISGAAPDDPSLKVKGFGCEVDLT